MAGIIPRDFIVELLTVIDVVEIIGSHLQLRRAGNEFKALCPFHEEDTPSFQVSPRKQFYYCFGCNASGDAISFLMRYRNLDFQGAVEELAHRAGLTIPRDSSSAVAGTSAASSHKHKELLYPLLERAVAYYREELQRQPRAKKYLAQRGLKPETLEKFHVGFAPGEGKLISLLRKQNVSVEHLRQSGLSSEDGRQDRFRKRIIFPIRDPRGRVVALGGRVLEAGQPKYLNSPESPVFHKKKELYGLYQPPGKPRPERYFLVEGYLDVLMLDQHGVPGAVATLGTSVTSIQLARLLRLCPRLAIFLDGDAAGRKASRKVLELLLPLLQAGREIDFGFLPEGEDPDSFVLQHGAATFMDKKLRRPLSTLLVRILLEKADLNSTEGRGMVLARAQEKLRQIPDPILRKGLIREVAKATHTPERELQNLVSGGSGARRTTTQPQTPPAAATAQPPKLLARAIHLLLIYPGFAGEIGKAQLLAELREPGLDFLLQLLEFLRQKPDSNCASILHHWRNSAYAKRLEQIAAGEESLEDKEALRREFHDTIGRLLQKLARQYVRDAGTTIKQLLGEKREARSESQQQRLRELQEAQRLLRKWTEQTDTSSQNLQELQDLGERVHRQQRPSNDSLPSTPSPKRTASIS